MVDVHCHVLPGVDDGARDVGESLAFLRAARDGGTTDIIATPHQHPARYPNEAGTLKAAHDTLLAACESAQADGEQLPRVHLGAEVHLDAGLVARLRAGELLTLAGSRHVLLELPDVFPERGVQEVIHEMLLAGFEPILAHPERIGQIVRHPRQLARMVQLGALAQVTGTSLAGGFGPECRALTEQFVDEGLVHFVASDAHDLRVRTPRLVEARGALAARAGEGVAQALLETHPRAVLEGRAVEAPRPTPPPPSRRPGLWQRLLGRDDS